MAEDRVPERPYRNARVRKDRMRSVAELEKRRKVEAKEREEKKLRAEIESIQPRCYVCGQEKNLERITIPVLAFHLCSVHYRELTATALPKLEEMRAVFNSGEEDAGISAEDTGVIDEGTPPV